MVGSTPSRDLLKKNIHRKRGKVQIVPINSIFSHSYVIWYVLCAANGKAIKARFLRDVASSRSNICTCNRAKMVHGPSRTECFVRCRSVFLARFAEKAVVFGSSVLVRAQSTHFLVARLREQAVIRRQTCAGWS